MGVPWLVFLLALSTTLHCPEAQTVADALLSMASENAATLTRGATNLLTSGLLPPGGPADATLPACSRTDVLLDSGGFPANWSSLPLYAQAAHPINVVMMQVAAAAYRPARNASACLAPMGVDASSVAVVNADVPSFASRRVVVIARAGRRIILSFKGSSALDLTTNMACRHVRPGAALLGGSSSSSAGGASAIGVHAGFWAGWAALEPGVLALVKRHITAGANEVLLVGHSLGAATAAVAALRLHSLLGASGLGLGGSARVRIAGAWLIASPRAGNVAWAAAYDAALGRATLRFTTWQDFAAQMPQPSQLCSVGGSSLNADTARFEYAHVGRSLLMCPDSNGLVQWRVAEANARAPGGGTASCGVQRGAELDASTATHMLGTYVDAWRRGFVANGGSDLGRDVHVRAVMCEACVVRGATSVEQLASPARPGGPVSCFVDASCSSKQAFTAATALNGGLTAAYSARATCQGFICTSPL